jgi:hypothetical protein
MVVELERYANQETAFGISAGCSGVKPAVWNISISETSGAQEAPRRIVETNYRTTREPQSSGLLQKQFVAHGRASTLVSAPTFPQGNLLAYP